MGNEEYLEFMPFFQVPDVADVKKGVDVGHVLKAVLLTLTEQERLIVQKRHGLFGDKKHSLTEIGKMLGLSGEQVRQIEARAYRKLRHPARKRYIANALSQG